LGKGTVIAPWREDCTELTVEGREESINALIAIATLRPLATDVAIRLAPVSCALARGEPALAAIALAQSGLPVLGNVEAAGALQCAAKALESGIAPNSLLQWAGLAPLEKFDPSQPRDEHGRWTNAGQAELAATTKNFDYACKKLGLDPNETSDAYHALKDHMSLGGKDNCVFDLENGDIAYNGELIGNLFHL
jgi:hypothetical protein